MLRKLQARRTSTFDKYYSCLACCMKVAQEYVEHARLGNIEGKDAA